MTLLRNETYSDYVNAFKNSVQSQDTNTTLKYHTTLIKNIQKDAVVIKETLKTLDNKIDSFDVNQINSRLDAIESILFKPNNITVHSPVSESTRVPIPDNSVNISTPYQNNELTVIPDIIGVKSIKGCVEQFVLGWDGIPALKDWPEAWKKGKNRVKYDQRKYIGLLYLSYSSQWNQKGRDDFYAKFGKMSVSDGRKACRLEYQANHK